MDAMDYGPIPVSRLKEEHSAIFSALDQGRRVLVSRRGVVVAAIEPASLRTHALQLAQYALGERGPEDELTATEIGQGSPSAFIKRAEEGHVSLLTRGNKVYGVLGPARLDETLDQVRTRESMLSEFERNHPEATPEEFARAGELADLAAAGLEVPSLTDVIQPADIHELDRGTAVGWRHMHLSTPPPLREPDVHVALAETSLDAVLLKGLALEHLERPGDAAEVLKSAVIKFGHEPDVNVRWKVAQVMVELAHVHTGLMKFQDALTIADEALSRLEDIEAKTD